MRSADSSGLDAVRSEGGLLPAELLARIAATTRADAPSRKHETVVPGLTPEDYHLGPGETLAEAITRAWNRLLAAWTVFREHLARLPEGDPAVAITRDRWLLPLFQELGYGRLAKAPAGSFTLGDREVPISHLYHRSPIHLVGAGVPLDRRTPGVAGAAGSAPHGLVQDFLNRSDQHLWAFVSNGRSLRILRDHRTLTRSAYVEFDLEAIFEGQLFHAFRLLWLVAHQSRVEAETPEGCWLEKWHARVRDEGVRALDDLRRGVERAIEAFGRGFLRHADNVALRASLEAGTLDRQDYYRQILRLVYRLIFLFVAEDRGVLLDPSATPLARERFERHYATRHLRDAARRRRGSAHGDRWEQLRVVMRGLAEGCPGLALPALGSYLWSTAAIVDLDPAAIANEDLFSALRELSTTIDPRGQRFAVNWRNVGAEELGSVYESLLELHPTLNVDTRAFDLASAAGHERKTTGSYYTPSSLVECLLDSALDPVIDAAVRGEEGASRDGAAQRILALKICDPACGSGHFLLAAARRVARRLAQVRSGDEEPSPEAQRHALREVVGHCLFGVDVNPMAVELCKVSLWLEAVEPGRPLTFLEAHIQCGNALLGATPALMSRGIPDEAWEPIEGDDKKLAGSLKKQNKEEHTELRFDFGSPALASAIRLGETAGAIDDTGDADLAAVRAKEAQWNAFVASDAYGAARFLADTWCAAFVWPKTTTALRELAPTEATFRALARDPGRASAALREQVAALALEHQFFHWHLAFPQVLRAKGAAANDDPYGWDGGFDVVLGNPPWERIKLQEQEFFAERSDTIAKAQNAAARKKKIAALETDDPALWAAWTAASRRAEGESHLVRECGRFPLCAKGDVNTYALFAEHNRSLLGAKGRAGFIVPSGIATDDTTKEYFRDVLGKREIVSFFDFRNVGFFTGVASAQGVRFALFTLGTSTRPSFVFRAAAVREISDPQRQITLTADDIALINPNTRTCPIFRTRRDAEITKRIYRRVPVLIRENERGEVLENPWGVSFTAMFHMTSDSGLFRTREQLERERFTLRGNVFAKGSERWLPLYEAKMVHHFDHRFGDYALASSESGTFRSIPQAVDRLPDAAYQPMSRYWVAADAVAARSRMGLERATVLAFRDITSGLDERTVIATVIPAVGVGNKLPLILLSGATLRLSSLLLGTLSSYVLDYVARQKVGGTSLNFFILKQFAVLHPSAASASLTITGGPVLSFTLPRVLELTYTAWDLEPFARDCGYDGPPFRWDPERRALLRAELDAAFFHLYGLARDDVDYIMDTFPIVRRHDEAAHGEYRTKRRILECYDAMAEAENRGTAYVTRLDPPPADPRVAHAASTRPAWAKGDGE